MTSLALTASLLLALGGGTDSVGLPAAAPRVPAASADNPYQKLVADHASAIVTIKFVMKMEMPGSGGDHEFEEEVFGVMMDPKGLVLVSNFQMGGMASRMGRGQGMSVTPTQIKILVGDDTEGVEAKLVTRDSELDLAWVKVEKAPEKPFAAVDFSKAAEPKLGETLLFLDRLDKYFDRVPMVYETKVGATPKKPRSVYLPSDEGRRYGVPVFTGMGETVGFAALQLPSEEDEQGMGMNRFRGAVVVLPAAEIVTATERAMKAAESAEKGDAGATEKPKTEAEPQK
ncbi:MAG: hypothetical protein ACT4PL_13255 [Phycisphaerales bacterium]